MKIGIIGAAEMGSLLATKLIALGHEVSIANSRGADTLKSLADEIGANAVSIEEVTKNKEVIIIAIPLINIPDLPKESFTNIPENVVVIETCNYYPTLRDGNISELQEIGIDSLWVQTVLGVTITKIFNSILATSLATLGKNKGDKDRIAIGISGDNNKSKEIAIKIANAFGFDTFDVGPISQSWKLQPGSPIYCRDLPLQELKKRADDLGNNWNEKRGEILSKRKADEKLMAKDYPEYLRRLKD